MQRSMILVAAVAALTSVWVAPAAHAAAPSVEHVSLDGSFVDRGFCDYPLRVEWRFHARRYTWTDASGEVTRWAQHGVFSETVRANGKLAVAFDRQNVIDEQAGSNIFIGTWSFRLPDGSFIRDAGRIVLTYDGSEVSFVAGPHPIQGTGEWVDRFCEAMA